MDAKLLASFVLFLSAASIASANVGEWFVTQQNVTCLIVQMNIKVNFTYIATDNSTKTASYRIPVNETSVDQAGSLCGHEDILKVSWKTNSFEMKFKSNNSNYDLSSFIINLNTSDIGLNDSMANQTVSVVYSDDSFEIPSNFSYHCNREQTLNATDGFLIISKVQFEAFRNDNEKKFSAAKDCDSNITPDIVPIAVGISLIALIVVVLIAYIVGRRRQQARGYLNIM